MQHRMITKFFWLSVDLCRESERESEPYYSLYRKIVLGKSVNKFN